MSLVGQTFCLFLMPGPYPKPMEIITEQGEYVECRSLDLKVLVRMRASTATVLIRLQTRERESARKELAK